MPFLLHNLTQVSLIIFLWQSSNTYAGTKYFDENRAGQIMEVVLTNRVGSAVSWSMTNIRSPCPGVTLSANGDRASLDLNSNAYFNFETCSSADFDIVASAGGFTVTCSVALRINDLNDLPVHPANINRRVNELSPVKTLVGMPLVATDEDAGQEVRYEIVEGADGFFDITECGGQIFVIDPTLNYEQDKKVYDLKVRVYDDNRDKNGNDDFGEIFVMVHVSVDDINERPYPDPAMNFAAFSISEGVLSGTATTPAVPSFLDPDYNDPLTLTITRNDKDNVADRDAFTIDSNNRLVVAPLATIDYESKTTFSITVTATDSGGLTAVQDITISVIDQNEPPALPSGLAYEIAENSIDGTLVGSEFIATDPDGGTVVEFYILNGNSNGGETDVFEIIKMTEIDPLANPFAGILRVKNVKGLDFETKQRFDLEVEVTDGSASTSTIITVTVSNVNEAPVFSPPSQSFDVDENQPPSYLISPPLSATDEDNAINPTFQQLVYSIVPSGKPGEAVFFVDSTSGRIGLKQSPDYEKTNSYTLDIRVSDTGNPPLSATTTVTIAINDINESPVMIPQSFTIPENSAGNTVVGKVEASDQDAADSVLTFALDNSGQTYDNAFFTVDANGDLKVASSIRTSNIWESNLDFELNPSLRVAVIVEDNGVLGPKKTAKAVMTVNLSDEPETPYFGFMRMAVKESSPLGTVLGSAVGQQLSASDWIFPDIKGGIDQDANQQATLQFSFVPQPDLFEITSVGIVRTIDDIPDTDTLSDTVKNYTVEVRDTTGLTSTGNLEIEILGTNNVPEFQNKPYSFSFPESLQPSDLGFQMPCDDKDSTDSLFFNIDSFSIEALRHSISIYKSPGNRIGQLRLVKQIDHEQYSSVDLVVSCRDQLYALDTAQVSLTITDVNEPPVLVPTTLQWSVEENSPNGKVVGIVRSTDVDEGEDNPRFTWTLNDPSAPFALATDGTITVTGPLDFETKKSYTMTVTVTDKGDLTDQKTLTISVTDINEDPSFTGGTASVSENDASWFMYLQGADPDAGANGTLSYSIVSGNPDGLFEVVPDTTYDRYQRAILRLKAPLDYENQEQHVLTIRAQDQGVGTAPSTVSVTITVVNLNDMTITGVAPTVHTTEGGSRICFNGTNFGPTQKKSADTGAATPTISAVYSVDPDNKFTATNCAITRQNTQFCCDTVAGFGQVTWTVTLGGADVAFKTVDLARTWYTPPVITGVSGVGNLPTKGGAPFLIEGTDFGPINSVITVEYGKFGAQDLRKATCTLVTPHRVLNCTSVPMSGKDLGFKVTVKGQASPIFRVPDASHRQPVITSFSGALSMETSGSEAITLIGADFGPSSLDPSRISATYQGISKSYTASDCRVSKAHTEVTCFTVAGVGQDMKWTLTINGITSMPSTLTTSYKPPVIVQVLGPGAIMADTSEPRRIDLYGTNFGPIAVRPENSTVPEPTELITVTYLSPAGVEYTATDCAVVVAHSKISCQSVEGTGTNMAWAVTILDAGSPLKLFAGTGYAPPTVSYYTGVGSSSTTPGGDVVTIHGKNFGRWDDRIDFVEYGEHGPEYNGSDCSITVPHKEMQCKTSPGAGASLKWTVSIDSQRSTLPSTSYGPPRIFSFSGLGATNSTTYGGQPIFLHGENFGPPPTGEWANAKFLDEVSFGITGFEYVMPEGNCQVQSHTLIACNTILGSGKDLVWRAKVQGQLGPVSAVTWSYLAPRLLNDKIVLPRGQRPTSGGNWVVLRGNHFAIGDDLTKIQVLWNGHGHSSSFTLDDADVLVRENSKMGDMYFLDEVEFRLPTGYGKGNTVAIQLRTGSRVRVSNTFQVDYDGPSINPTIENKEYRDVVNARQLTIRGENFCLISFDPRCGRVTIDEVPVPPHQILSWAHDEIVMYTDKDEGSINVETWHYMETVGNNTITRYQRSNTVGFRLDVPALDFLVEGPDGQRVPGNFTSMVDSKYLGLLGQFSSQDGFVNYYRHGLSAREEGYDMHLKFSTAGGQMLRFPGLNLATNDTIDVTLGERPYSTATSTDLNKFVSHDFTYRISIGSFAKNVTYYRGGRVDSCYVEQQLFRDVVGSSELFEVACRVPPGMGNPAIEDRTARFAPPIWSERRFPFFNAISVLYLEQRSAREPPHFVSYLAPKLECSRAVSDNFSPDTQTTGLSWWPRPDQPEFGTSVANACDDLTVWIPTRGGHLRLFGNNFGSSSWVRFSTTPSDQDIMPNHQCTQNCPEAFNVNNRIKETCAGQTDLFPTLIHDMGSVCRKSASELLDCPGIWSSIQKADGSGLPVEDALDSLGPFADQVRDDMYSLEWLLMSPTDFMDQGYTMNIDTVREAIVRHLVAHSTGIVQVPPGVGTRTGKVVTGLYLPSVFWKISLATRELMSYNLESMEMLTVKYLPPSLQTTVYEVASTIGGEIITIYGDNFGPKNVIPTVLIGGRVCNVTALLNSQGFRTDSDPHTEISCILPEGSGAGKAVEVWVNGVYADQGTALVDYPEPTIHYVFSPTSTEPPHPSGHPAVATDGKDTIHVWGENFGPGPVLPELPYLKEGDRCTYELQSQAADAPYGSGRSAFNEPYDLRLLNVSWSDMEKDLPVPKACLLSWNHTFISFRVPEGHGLPKTLQLIVDLQVNDPDSPQFIAYGAPRLNDPRITDCNTDGADCMIELEGDNLGRPRNWRGDLNESVLINGRVCRTLYYSDTIARRNGIVDEEVRAACNALWQAGGLPWLLPNRECDLGVMHPGFVQSPDAAAPIDPESITILDHHKIRCLAPGGYGVDLESYVDINGQQSDDFLFSYNPPNVRETVPNVPDPILHPPISFLGNNFGPAVSPYTPTLEFDELPHQTLGFSSEGTGLGLRYGKEGSQHFLFYADRGNSPSVLYLWSRLTVTFQPKTRFTWPMSGAEFLYSSKKATQGQLILCMASGNVIYGALVDELSDSYSSPYNGWNRYTLPSSAVIQEIVRLPSKDSGDFLVVAYTQNNVNMIRVLNEDLVAGSDVSTTFTTAGPMDVEVFNIDAAYYLAVTQFADGVTEKPVTLFKMQQGKFASAGPKTFAPAVGYNRIQHLTIGGNHYAAALCSAPGCNASAIFAWNSASETFFSTPTQRIPMDIAPSPTDVQVITKDKKQFLVISNDDSPKLNEAEILAFPYEKTVTQLFNLKQPEFVVYMAAGEILPLVLPTTGVRTLETVSIKAPPSLPHSALPNGPPLNLMLVLRLPGKFERINVPLTSVQALRFEGLTLPPCTDTRIIDDHFALRCQPQPGAETVGPKQVVLGVSGYEGQMFLNAIEYRCQGGYYGQQTEQCRNCPLGAHCACEYGTSECQPLPCLRKTEASYVCDKKDLNSQTSESASGSCTVLVKDCNDPTLPEDVKNVFCSNRFVKVRHFGRDQALFMMSLCCVSFLCCCFFVCCSG